MPNRWRDILDSLRKSGSRELKEGVYQLCSYYQCTLFERSPLWYLVHNQMIQNKRSQLVWDINICCGAYGWCRHMLWSICLVCQVEQANPWGKTPTNISTSKKFAFTIFPDEMCKWRQIRFPPTSALVKLFWQVVVGWRENLLCKLFVTLCVHQMVLQKTTNGGKFVTSCLAVTWERSCHSDDNASQIVRFSRKGLTPCFVGTNFSAACVCVTVVRKMFGDK